MKAYYPRVERKPIVPPQKRMIELHRGVRVDPYPNDITADMLKSCTALEKLPHLQPFQERLADFYKVPKENLILTSGVEGAIKTAFEMCTKIGSEVIYLTPTFMMYPVYSKSFGVTPIEIQAKSNFKVDLQQILNSISNKTDVVFIPNPNQPVENVFSLDDLRQVADLCQKTNTLVFIDEAYSDFGAPTALDLIREFDNLVVARSFSKGFGLASIRLGCLMGQRTTVGYLESKRLAYASNGVGVAVGNWALDHLRYFETYNREIIETRDWLKTQLSQQNVITHGSCSNRILIYLGTVGRKIEVSQGLEQCNIRVCDSLPDPAEACISVTIGSREAMEYFLECFLSILGSL